MRPEGWLPSHAPAQRETNWQRYIEQIKQEEYERGKRELLDALKETGVYGPHMDNYLKWASIPIDCKGKSAGWLVFIPDSAESMSADPQSVEEEIHG